MAGTKCISYRDIRRQVELLGVAQTVRHLSEALERDDKGHADLKPSDFSIRELFEGLYGREALDSLRPKSGRFEVMESDSSAVSYSHFSNITGQLIFTEIKQAYENEEFVFSTVVETKPSKFLDTEKIPGITGVGDEAEVIKEGDPYPVAGVSEDYITVGAKKKRGNIIQVTREAIFGDLTGQLLDRCSKLGYWLGLNKEKRIIDAVIDENGGAASIVNGGHRYHWKDTSYATYQASSPWVNIKTGNALLDWTDVENAELLLADMIDPYTGEPIMLKPTHIIVTPQNLHSARRVMGATNVALNAGGYAQTGNLYRTDAPSTLDMYQIMSSRLLKARAATDTDWWFGNPRGAVRYYSNWDIETSQAAAGHPDEFGRDVISQYKASERGTAQVIEPRLMVENQA